MTRSDTNGAPPQGGWLALAREVLDIEIEGLAAVRGQLNGGFEEALALLAGCKGRVVVTGIGKSGLVARKIAATLSSTGTPAFFLHPVEGAHGDLGMIRTGDVVLALSNSGETDELNTLLPALKSLGALIVGLTSGSASTLARMSDAVVEVRVPREACPMGLAPTASTTAALAVGDALAVCLMRLKDFGSKDFKRVHPGGALGARLSQRIESLMHTENLPLAAESAPLSEALAALNAGGFGLAALTDAKGRLAGVLTDGDVRRMLCQSGFNPAAPVSEVMTKNPRSIAKSASAAQVLDLMEARQITVLPVLNDDGSLAGLVHVHDLLGKGRVRFAPE
ncbi:MAG: SIS domain-containing protein [Desulfovibrio sp.]|jgi:arabinose-5-phosphate isomerase